MKRLVFPKTQPEGDNLLVSEKRDFGAGMLQDFPISEIPKNGLYRVDNFDVYRNYLRGRNGHRVFTACAFAVNLTDASETLGVSIQSGEIFVANGSAVPAVGTFFRVLSYNEDVSGNELGTAKGSTVETNDVFRIENSTGGSESVAFMGNPRIPALDGRTGVTATKSGTTITATAGPAFVKGSDIGRYFVWPSGENEEIVSVTSTTVIEVRTSTVPVTTGAGGYVRGRPFGQEFHLKHKKIVLHVDKRIFVASWQNIGWIEARKESFDTLALTRSEIYEKDDYMIIVNSGGSFKVRVDEQLPYFWKINTAIPSVLVTNAPTDGNSTDLLPHGRRYIYAMARIKNTNLRDNEDRNTSGAFIEQISGTTKVNSTGIDYGTIYTALPPGAESETSGKITGGALGASFDSAIEWAAITDGTINITIDSITVDFTIDFSAVTSMAGVGRTAQTAFRKQFPNCVVEFKSSVFNLLSGKNGSTIAFATAGVGGTDVAQHFKWRTGDSGSIKTGADTTAANNNSVTSSRAVGELTIPFINKVSPDTAEYLWTHYVPFASLELGVDGKDPISGIVNNPNAMGRLGDIPIAKSFNVTATSDAGGDIITINSAEGLFHQTDVGDDLEWQTGDNRTIAFLSDSVGAQVFTDTSLFAVATANTGAIAAGSAGLGGGTIITASQTGTALTIGSGITLDTTKDVGKAVYWANGRVTRIKSVTNGTTAVMWESITFASQAAMIDPVRRTFSDQINEDDLRARVAVGKLRPKSRGWEELPDHSVGVVGSGFLVVAKRGAKIVHYSQIPEGFEYLVGYHAPDIQSDTGFKDAIQAIILLAGRFYPICANTVWGTDTVDASDVSDDRTGESARQLSPFALVDEYGCVATGSIKRVGLNRVKMLCSDMSFRFFDGAKFSEDTARFRISKTVKKLSGHAVAHYDDRRGYVFWGAIEIPA